MPISPQASLPAEFSLAGQTAIVASAGGDESPFLAAALAEAGASVFAVARHQNTADAIADAVTAATGNDTHRHAGRWDTPDGAAGVVEALRRCASPG